MELSGELVAESREELAAEHATPEAFVAAYFRLYARWMKESKFRSGCPIATTLLETAPLSKPIRSAELAAFEKWTRIIASVFERAGVGARPARQRAELAIAALEGALILARVTRSVEPILNAGRALARDP